MSDEYDKAALPPGAVVESLAIERVLEQGRFSTAYLVRDEGHVRVLREFLPQAYIVREGSTMQAREAEDRNALRWWMRIFIDQTQILSRLRHPTLPAVQRVFEANNTAYAVTEPVLGETLAAVLAREGTVDEPRLRRILQSLLDGLERTHAAGLLHRDIRPQNVMVRPDGSAVLVDFAVLRTPVRFKSGLLSGAGMAPYAAPEERVANAVPGAWTDLYALGALSYRAICGIDPPAAAERAAGTALLPAAQATRVRASEALLGAIDHALLLAPALRPQTVTDWRAELRAESAATVTLPLAAKPRTGSRSGTRLALPVLLIALAGAGYWAYSRLPQTTSSGASLPESVVSSKPVVAGTAAPAVVSAPTTAAESGASTDAPSSLDRLALDLMSKDRKAQDALRDQKLQEQRDKDDRERKAREAGLPKPETDAAAEKTTPKPIEKPAKPAAATAPVAEDAAASARTRQLEDEIARLKAESGRKAEDSDSARLAREKSAHDAEVAAQAERERQAQIIAKARKSCRIPAPSLSAAGNLTFDTASRVPGAERLNAGLIRLPPVTTSDGETRQFEITADSCARLVN